jgi:hypothetical protein
VFANILTDAMMGLGCVTFSFALMAFAAALLALRCGLLPGVSEKLKQLWGEPSPPDGGRGRHDDR